MGASQSDEVRSEEHATYTVSCDPPSYMPPPPPPQLPGGYIRFTMLKDPMVEEYSLRPTDILRNVRVPKIIPWHSELAVQVRHMPTLMDNGFFWSEADINREESHCTIDQCLFNPFPRDLGYTHLRVFHLKDKAHVEPHWLACLTVYAHGYEELQRFKPRELTLDNILFAVGNNGSGHMVYYFDRQCSSKNFNAISGDAPLAGWWPWPKEKPCEDGPSSLTEETQKTSSS